MQSLAPGYPFKLPTPRSTQTTKDGNTQHCPQTDSLSKPASILIQYMFSLYRSKRVSCSFSHFQPTYFVHCSFSSVFIHSPIPQPFCLVGSFYSQDTFVENRYPFQ